MNLFKYVYVKIIIGYFFLCFYRFGGIMEVHYDGRTVETGGKRSDKKFMETYLNRFLNSHVKIE